MDRRQRDLEQQLRAHGFTFELVRQKKHMVYRLTAPDGRVTMATFSKSASDWRKTMNIDKFLRKLGERETVNERVG